MKTIDIISKVLYWLGMLLCIGGVVALEILDFGNPVIWVNEFNQITAAIIIGLVMMAASIIIDWIPLIRKRGNHDK